MLLPPQGLSPSFIKVQPLLLIGSDNSHLITQRKRVCFGPPGASAAHNTQLGWTLQGPTFLQERPNASQALFTSTGTSYTELSYHVKKLWQIDILPFKSEKLITRPRQDKAAMKALEAKTVRVKMDGTKRYATPLPRIHNVPNLQAPMESAILLLRQTEHHLVKVSAEQHPRVSAAQCHRVTWSQAVSCPYRHPASWPPFSVDNYSSHQNLQIMH